MNNEILERQEILEHYESALNGLDQKEAGANNKAAGSSSVNLERGDLLELIKQKERKIARCNELLGELTAASQATSSSPDGPSLGLPIAAMNMI